MVPSLLKTVKNFVNTRAVLGSSQVKHLCIVWVSGCQAEHLPCFVILIGRWQAGFIVAYIHIPSGHWYLLSIICHSCPFFGVLFIQIISPLLVGCPFIVKLWAFFVAWRWEKLYHSFSSSGFSLHSHAFGNSEGPRGYFVFCDMSLWSQRGKCAQARVCGDRRHCAVPSRHCCRFQWNCFLWVRCHEPTCLISHWPVSQGSHSSFNVL